MQQLVQKVKENDQIRDLRKHKILQDQVLVVPVDFESDSQVYTPTGYEDKPEWAVVIHSSDGSQVDESDFILFSKYGAQKVTVEGVDFLFIHNEDILSKYAS
jgi:co-chaperonin GroES (HSP10)